MLKNRIVTAGLLFLFWCLPVGPANAGDDQVTRDILSIMHEKGDIPDDTYNELIEKMDQPENTVIVSLQRERLF